MPTQDFLLIYSSRTNPLNKACGAARCLYNLLLQSSCSSSTSPSGYLLCGGHVPWKVCLCGTQSCCLRRVFTSISPFHFTALWGCWSPLPLFLLSPPLETELGVIHRPGKHCSIEQYPHPFSSPCSEAENTSLPQAPVRESKNPAESWWYFFWNDIYHLVVLVCFAVLWLQVFCLFVDIRSHVALADIKLYLCSKVNAECLILLPPSPKSLDYRYVLPCPVLCCTGNWTMLGKHSPNWAITSAPHWFSSWFDKLQVVIEVISTHGNTKNMISHR